MGRLVAVDALPCGTWPDAAVPWLLGGDQEPGAFITAATHLLGNAVVFPDSARCHALGDPCGLRACWMERHPVS